MALITSLTDRLFDGIQVQKDAWEEQDDTARATIVVNNVRLTASWATFKEIRHSLLAERGKGESHAKNDTTSSGNRQNLTHGGSFAFGPISVGDFWGRETDDQHFHSFTTADQMQTEDRDALENVLLGKIPASMMRVDQVQKLVSRCQTSWDVNLGSFRRSEAVFANKQSLQILHCAATMEQLLKRKAKLEAEIATQQDKKKKALSRLIGAVRPINDERAKLLAAHAAAMDYQFQYGRHEGMIEWMVLVNKVNGIPIPQVHGPYDGHKAEMNANAAAAAKAHATVAQANLAIAQNYAVANQAESTIVQCEKEISRLRGEVANVVQEMITLAR